MCGEGHSEYMPSDERVVVLVREWAQLTYTDEVPLSVDLATAIQLWWASPAIIMSYDQRKQSHVMDNTPYFMSKVLDLAQPTYEVTFDDWVRLRNRTTGIIPVTFPVVFGGEVWAMEVTDVGGQRSERKKWLSIFGDVNAVIYVMSLSAYDQVVFEDHTTNCYVETLNLFSDTVNVSAFDLTDFIVFLNKWGVCVNGPVRDRQRQTDRECVCVCLLDGQICFKARSELDLSRCLIRNGRKRKPTTVKLSPNTCKLCLSKHSMLPMRRKRFEASDTCISIGRVPLITKPSKR